MLACSGSRRFGSHRGLWQHAGPACAVIRDAAMPGAWAAVLMCAEVVLRRQILGKYIAQFLPGHLVAARVVLVVAPVIG
jgi:hypothetical protein